MDKLRGFFKQALNLKNLTFLQEESHPIFGDIKVYSQNNSNKKYFSKIKLSNTQEEHDQAMIDSEERMKINHPNLL